MIYNYLKKQSLKIDPKLTQRLQLAEMLKKKFNSYVTVLHMIKNLSERRKTVT